MDAQGRSDLCEAVLAALRPVGLAGRVRARLLRGGMTVRQVLDALPAEGRPAPGPLAGVAAEQHALEQVRRALEDLVVDGRVRRERARLRYTLNTKGSRLFEVDVYRLA